MNKYIALLRGINISGKNKVPMIELRDGFVELGYENVSTYINSGNVIFNCNDTNRDVIVNNIKLMIKNRFKIDIPVIVITGNELSEILENAPLWWGLDNKEIYDNIIFIMPSVTYDDVYKEIGDPKLEYEKICNYKNVIFWSFKLKDYSKTNWIRTASSNINDMVTIRTSNTMKKIFEIINRE